MSLMNNLSASHAKIQPKAIGKKLEAFFSCLFFITEMGRQDLATCEEYI